MTSKRRMPWRGRAASVAAGVLVGLVLALFTMAGDTAVARDPDVLYYEMDLSRDLTEDDIEAFIAFAQSHQGRDIILEPAGDYRVPLGEERRQADAERSARESAEQAEMIGDRMARGEWVDDPDERAACQDAQRRATDGPARYLLCEGEAVSAPAVLPNRRASSRGQAETLLDQRLRDLLRGVTGEEEALGFTSNFSDDTALERLTFDQDGRVEVRFNERIRPQLAGLHPGSTSHYMLEQLFKTLFQFRDVRAVELTLDGDCDAFGALIEGPCQAVDRALWERINELNAQPIDYFTLQGARR